MHMHAPAHRRDDVLPVRHSHSAPATPALQLASVIGNHAMRRLLTAPVVQRSLWDDLTEAVSEPSNWSGGGDTVAEPPPDVEEAAPMNDPGVVEDARQEAGAENATDEGSWFENWFGEQEQGQTQEQTLAQEQEPAQENTTKPTGMSEFQPEAATDDECARLEAEIARLDAYIQELYDQSQALLPELEAAKAEAEALEKSAPGSPQAAEARQRYNSLHQRYDAVVNECLYLMEMRNQLRQQLADCRSKQKGKMPKGFPCC